MALVFGNNEGFRDKVEVFWENLVQYFIVFPKIVFPSELPSAWEVIVSLVFVKLFN